MEHAQLEPRGEPIAELHYPVVQEWKATLDGMGPLCYDSCAETERIEISSLVPRTSLIAGIIQDLTELA